MKLMNFTRSLSFEVLSSELQCLAFSTHVPGRNTSVQCLKGRVFSSSVPVRYIPKKKRNGLSESSQQKLNDKGPIECADADRMKGLSGIGGVRSGEVVDDKSKWSREFTDTKSEGSSSCGGFQRGQVMDGGHNNTVIPEKKMDFKGNLRGFWTGEIVGGHGVFPEENCARNDNESDLGLTDHDLGSLENELTGETGEVEEMEVGESYQRSLVEVGKAKQDGEKLAIELLATRGYTAVELRKKLHAKRFSHAIIDEIISNFQSRGLINDNLYAETFSRSRWSSSTWGPRRIKQALYKKGISVSDADKAIKLVFEDGESDGDQESRHGMSKVSMDRLIVQASKQWLRGRDVPRETQKSRIIRWLQYRGFNWNVISFVIKKLEAQYCP